ncbi:MAG: hypothetical protein KKF27_21795 [Gammaproteobacteria bacterium]|nr:hypothetical protein [Gammaproteobacteria bacterium]
MALETLTRQTASRDPAEFSYQNVTIAGGFEFPNDGHTFIVCNNDAGAVTLTFTIQKTLDSQSATRVETITASKVMFLGPFPVELYNDADGYVFVTPNQDMATDYGVAVVTL